MTIHAHPKSLVIPFAANDTTPDVSSGNLFITANTVPTTITMFDGGLSGQSISVIVDDSNTTIDFTGGHLIRASGTDYIAASGDMLTGIYDGTDWHCSIISRDVVVYDDIRFPFTLDKQGQASKPDYDFNNLGLLFPQNDATEIVHVIINFPHDWMIGSDIYPHIHYVQDEAQIPVFKMDYRWYDTGSDPTIGFTTIATTGILVPYTAGSISQYVNFPAISSAGISGLSPIMDVKIYRDDNIVAGDILVKEFDIHVQLDAAGSRSQYEKW